jgi:hypothetical protein
MSDLFQPDDAPDDAYRNLRDDEQAATWRAFCEDLWRRFEPYADPHFPDEIKRQFHQRFWEMYLGVMFLDRGFKLHKKRSGGPEFGIDIEGRRYWFDAIAPTHGIGPDAVPEEGSSGRAARAVPEREMILRYTNALAAKRAKWSEDLEKCRVSEADGFIVAINDRSARWTWVGMEELPYIAKALFGIGDVEIMFDLETLDSGEARWQHRPKIEKKSGAEVSSQAFAARECPDISAVLYSHENAANHPECLGEWSMLLHNVEPNVPLPLGALLFRREYWVEGNRLRWKDGSSLESS